MALVDDDVVVVVVEVTISWSNCVSNSDVTWISLLLEFSSIASTDRWPICTIKTIIIDSFMNDVILNMLQLFWDIFVICKPGVGNFIWLAGLFKIFWALRATHYKQIILDSYILSSNLAANKNYSAGRTRSLSGPDLVRGLYFAHPCCKVTKTYVKMSFGITEMKLRTRCIKFYNSFPNPCCQLWTTLWNGFTFAL